MQGTQPTTHQDHFLLSDRTAEQFHSNLGIPYTAVGAHACPFFNEETGKLTGSSIQKTFVLLEIPMNLASAKLLKGVFKTLGCTHLSEITKLLHKSSTGMFNHEGPDLGQFNETVYAEKCQKYAPNGKFTEASITQMVKDVLSDDLEEIDLLSICGPFRWAATQINALPTKQEFKTLLQITKTPGEATTQEMKDVHTEVLFKDQAQRVEEARMAQSSSSSSSTAQS